MLDSGFTGESQKILLIILKTVKILSQNLDTF